MAAVSDTSHMSQDDVSNYLGLCIASKIALWKVFGVWSGCGTYDTGWRCRLRDAGLEFSVLEGLPLLA